MNLIKNYLYNASYQVLVLIIPLVTMPYIARVLGSEMVGKYAFTFSISQYFVLIATVGITMYGCRTISYSRNNKVEMSSDFWSIFLIKCITSIISIATYAIFIVFFLKDNYSMYIIQGLNILSVLVDITWFFNGIELLKNIVRRNLIIKVISIILIFSLVKTQNDIYIYTSIIAGSLLIGQFVMWKDISKYVNPLKYSKISIKKHIRPIIALFIPQIAVQIYVVLDKTMLGIFTTESNVAFYDMAIKIVKMSLAVVTSLGMVMMPRIANEFSNGNIDKIREYVSKSLNFVCSISIPMMFGIMGVSKEFIEVFLGDGFRATSIIMSILSPIVIFMAISNVIGIQCMIPTGNEKKFTMSVSIAAFINLILNLIFIPKYGYYAASISTLIAEFSVALIQIMSMKKFVNIKSISPDIIKSFIAGLIMYILIRGLFSINFNLILVVILGGISYFICLFVTKSDILIEFITVIKKFASLRKINKNN